jgi:hypothetical protein
MTHALTRGTATKITLPSGDEFLLVQIEIECPACGSYAASFAGHHLRRIRDLLVEFIDLHPDLTGQVGDLETVRKLQWEGRTGGHPEEN